MAIPIIGDIIGKVIDKGAEIINKRVADKDLATQLNHDFQSLMLTSQTDLEKGAQEIAKAQLEVAKEQAKHPSLFVSGARPAIMWICGAGIGYNFVILPLMQYASFLAGMDLSGAPELNVGELTALLTGMLGLGGYRTFEKKNGVARDNLKAVE